MKQQQKDNIQVENDEEYDSSDISDYSSEDEDAVLLTQKVQEKLLQTVARLRTKDPSIYQTVNPIFNDEDFQDNENRNKQKNDKNNKKFTYKDMLKQGVKESEQSQDEQLPPAMQEKKAKNKFKQALKKQKNVIDQQGDEDDLFTVKGKLKKEKNVKQEQSEDKFEQFMKKMKPESKKLIKSVWQNPQKMDQTDVFLRDYILNKKWLSKHINDGKAQSEFQKIDQEDEQRSVEMDEHEAKYNFRFQEPDGDKIIQYPRKIQQSMRIKPQSRKDKRKKVQERKKQQQQKIREQAEKKKEQLRTKILNKLQQNQQQTFDQEGQKMQEQDDEYDENLEHDWFFCDDCGKAFHEQETNYQCEECEDYMLCEDCHDLIIHKHPLYPAVIPIGFGAPKESVSAKILSKLQPCKTCRRRIPETVKHFSYEDRAKNVQLLCDRCYDESPLDVKKKFLPVEAKINEQNIEQVLEKDPQKIKQLTNSKEIEQMVDEYLKYEFEDVIGDGMKTKFKYVNVKPQDFGLSDQQILFGDDKQLNKYVSIKKLAPYRESKMKLRNNIYKKKITTIDKTVKQNKQLIDNDKIERKIKKTRLIDKLKRRTQVMKKRRQTKLKILNISNPAKEKKVFVPSSRLESYGVTLENKQQQQNTQPYKNKTKK